MLLLRSGLSRSFLWCCVGFGTIIWQRLNTVNVYQLDFKILLLLNKISILMTEHLNCYFVAYLNAFVTKLKSKKLLLSNKVFGKYISPAGLFNALFVVPNLRLIVILL